LVQLKQTIINTCHTS